jgi:hypothetical protein
MKYIKVRIVIGSSNGIFDIYYDSIDSNKRALLYSNGQPAIGLTFDELSGPNGVLVSVPDESSSIVVTSDPDSFCSNNISVNDDSYTVPIGCYTYTITSSNGVYNYYYTDCDCNEISATIDGTNGQVEESFCALYGTVDAGELELTFVEGCETTSIELCYDQNSPALACECELVPTPTSTPTPTPTPTSTLPPYMVRLPFTFSNIYPERHEFEWGYYDCNNNRIVTGSGGVNGFTGPTPLELDTTIEVNDCSNTLFRKTLSPNDFEAIIPQELLEGAIYNPSLSCPCTPNS